MDIQSIKDKLILTNVHKYKTDDAGCENICLRARLFGIGNVLVGPSSVPCVKRYVGSDNIKISCSAAYPSGAYFPDAKAEEVDELVKLYPYIDSFFVVAAVGRFLSGYEKEAREEMELVKKAADGRKVYFVTECALMDEERTKRIFEIAAETGVDGIMDTAGFKYYDVPFPGIEDIKRAAAAKKAGQLLISNSAYDSAQGICAALEAGADMIVASDADFLFT